jgi:hypothetical protein
VLNYRVMGHIAITCLGVVLFFVWVCSLLLFVYMQVFSAQSFVVCIMWYSFLYSYIISILFLHMLIILNQHCRLGVTVVMRRGDLVVTNSCHCDRCIGCPCTCWWLPSELLCAIGCEIRYFSSAQIM